MLMLGYFLFLFLFPKRTVAMNERWMMDDYRSLHIYLQAN